jgi:hypothetical protein
MLILSSGQTGNFEFIFSQNGNFYDPTSGATPSDVIISVYRGDFGAGAIIDGPFSYLQQNVDATGNYIEKSSNNTFYYGNYGDIPGQNVSSYNLTKFVFHYTIPQNLFQGNYSVVATTYSGVEILQYTAQFQVPQGSMNIVGSYAGGEKELSTSYRPSFQPMEQYKTNSILLIGHSDTLEINAPMRIGSIQEGIDLLKADFNSPLLRGIFDAYACGARDIYICSAAPMKEYVSITGDRLSIMPTHSYEDATPVLMNFYQKYYDRLEKTYASLERYDNIDIIVPLEASIIGTGNIDFVTQLATHCQNFHDETGAIMLGVIGSRSDGINSSNIDIFEEDINFTDKYTMYNPDNSIAGDMGKFVIPIYGEIIINHNFLNISYTSSAAASMAGLLSETAVNQSLIRRKIPSAFGLSGTNLSQAEVDRLDALGINTLIRNNRSRRGNSYEIYLTNDYTMANVNSTYAKAPQMRLVSMVSNEIRALGDNSVSRFSAQKLIEDVKKMLQFLKINNIIREYNLEAYADSVVRGKIYFDINLTSSLALRKISFSISSGQGA